MMKKFKACKHLSFDQEKYICKLVQISNFLGWERKDPEGKVRLCQFCSLRGRLNHPESCIGEKNAMCSEYEEREVEYDQR